MENTQEFETLNRSKYGPFVLSVLEYCPRMCVTLTHFLGQRGELVNVLAGVLAARHAETELEIKAL